MQKRRVGQCDIEVSVLGLGTVKFGRNQAVKYPAAFTLPSDQEITNLLAIAHECGINLLDTAPAYGKSEERLGALLQGKRHDWVISTKVGEAFMDGESHFDFSASAVRLSIEQSLKKLRTDYLDIVLVHSNGDDKRIIQEENIFTTLAALKKDGKLRAYGMSTKTVEGGLLTIDNADIAMLAFNPTYADEREVIAYADQQQKGIFIKKGLVGGHLQTIASDDPVMSAMRFIFAEAGVTSVIVGTINPLHLRQNVESVAAVLLARKADIPNDFMAEREDSLPQERDMFND